MRILKQSTAVDVLVGPFVNDTDGATAETGLTLDVQVSKNGQALGSKNDATTPVHDALGYYNCELDATDTATVGNLTLVAAPSGALPWRGDWQVVEETVYDALYGSGGTGALPVSNSGISSSAFTSGAITADALASDAITAAKVAADVSTEISAQVLADLKDQDRQGTAQAGGNTSITLAVGDQEADDFYNGATIVLLEGTGTSGLTVAERTRRITDYVNSTNIATVDRAWGTNPSSDTVYAIFGG